MSVSTQYAVPGDTPLGAIAEKVLSAQEALLNAVHHDPTREWRLRDLISATKNGWTNSVMSIAFWGLVEQGSFQVDEQLVVHLGS